MCVHVSTLATLTSTDLQDKALMIHSRIFYSSGQLLKCNILNVNAKGKSYVIELGHG